MYQYLQYSAKIITIIYEIISSVNTVSLSRSIQVARRNIFSCLIAVRKSRLRLFNGPVPCDFSLTGPEYGPRMRALFCFCSLACISLRRRRGLFWHFDECCWLAFYLPGSQGSIERGFRTGSGLARSAESLLFLTTHTRIIKIGKSQHMLCSGLL